MCGGVWGNGVVRGVGVGVGVCWGVFLCEMCVCMGVLQGDSE